ncbi:MAG: IclR family transcriptional regulator C-terminal domain-containing protein [Burkholderiaceae bacterium]
MNKKAAADETSDTPPARRDEYVNSFANGLKVIVVFGQERRPMTLSEVAERGGLTRATARRILLTLQALGYVGQQERLFFLTAKVLELGYAYLSSQGIAELALPAMERLSAEIDESCSMSVLEGDDIVYVARVPTRRVMTISLGVGARLPAYATSMGRVLLGGLPDADLAARLAGAERQKLTSFTLTEAAALRTRIRADARQGWSMVKQELELGLVSVAVPVAGRNGEVFAALNVGTQYRSGVEGHLKEQVLPALKATAEAISRALAQRMNAAAAR